MDGQQTEEEEEHSAGRQGRRQSGKVSCCANGNECEREGLVTLVCVNSAVMMADRVVVVAVVVCRHHR